MSQQNTDGTVTVEGRNLLPGHRYPCHSPREARDARCHHTGDRFQAANGTWYVWNQPRFAWEPDLSGGLAPLLSNLPSLPSGLPSLPGVMPLPPPMPGLPPAPPAPPSTPGPMPLPPDAPPPDASAAPGPPPGVRDSMESQAPRGVIIASAVAVVAAVGAGIVALVTRKGKKR